MSGEVTVTTPPSQTAAIMEWRRRSAGGGAAVVRPVRRGGGPQVGLVALRQEQKPFSFFSLFFFFGAKQSCRNEEGNEQGRKAKWRKGESFDAERKQRYEEQA